MAFPYQETQQDETAEHIMTEKKGEKKKKKKKKIQSYVFFIRERLTFQRFVTIVKDR